MAEERKIALQVEVDASGVKSGFDEVGRQADAAAARVTKAGQDASKSIAGIGQGGAEAAGKVDSATRSIIGSIQRTTAAQQAGEKGSAAYYEALAGARGVNTDILRPYLDQLRQAEAAQKSASGSLDKMGVSAGQTRQALAQLPMQFSDIVVSLQGGQAPLTVFLQQGAQIKESFGGAGAALKAMGGYVLGLVNPFTLAAAAVAGIAVAYNQGSKEADAYQRAIILTGNAAGTTAAQMQTMAARMDAVSGTQAQAAAALATFAAGGKVAAESLEQFASAALAFERATGQAVSETAKQFAELQNAPLTATLKLNEGMNYLTESTLRQITALEAQGRTIEAANLAQNAYADTLATRAKDVQANLGIMERGWNRVSGAAKDAWDSMLNVGRASTMQDRLSEAQKALADYQNTAPGKRTTEMVSRVQSSGGEAGLRSQILGMQELLATQAKSAEMEKQRGDAVRASAGLAQEAIKHESELEKQRRSVLAATEKYQQALKNDSLTAAQRNAIEADYLKIVSGITEVKKKDKPISAPAGQSEVASIRARVIETQRYIDAMQAQGLEGAKLTEGEKLALRIREELNGTLSKTARANKEIALAEAERLAGLQKSAGALETQLKAQKAFESARDKEAMASAGDIAKIHEKAQALEDEAAAYGKTAVELQALTIARLQDKQAMLAAFDPVASQDEVAKIDKMIAGLTRLGAAGANLGGIKSAADESKKALDDLNNFLDPAKATSFGDALKGAFEGAGSALASLVNSLDNYGQKEAEIAKMRANLSAVTDPAERAKKEVALANLSSKAQINAYASMAGAAKGFFKEGTAGYKTMGAVEKAFRAVELAMAIKNTAMKLGLIGSEVTATVAGQGAITGAVVAGEQTRTAAKTPGIFASFMSFLGPWGIAAAVAAMAGVGIMVSAGNNVNTLPATNDGTGTVFGDASAKSESIEKTIDLLEGISKFAGIENSYASKMLASLRSIEQQIGGFTNVILRAGGVEAAGAGVNVGTKSYGLQAGPLDFVGKHLFKTKVSVTGQGLYAGDATLGQIGAGGLDAGYYADINKKKKFAGMTVSNKNSTQLTKDNEVSRQISLLLTDFANSVKLAAPVLGFALDAVDARLNDFVVSIGRVDLKDLSGAEIQEKLNAVFGAAGDNIAQAAIPGLAHLQQVGEGYFETLARVASTLSSVNQMFDTLSVKLIDSSIAGAGAAVSFANLFGGLENMASVVGDYYEAYYDEAERMGKATEQLAAEFSKMGEEMPATKDAYRDLVTEQLNAGEAGQALAAKLLLLNGAFAQVADYAEQAAEAQAEALQQLRSSLIGLESGFAGGGFSRQYKAQDAATQLQSLLSGAGIDKDAGQLAQTLLSATAAEVEGYFREIWDVLDTDEARQKLVDVGSAMMDLAKGADGMAEAYKAQQSELQKLAQDVSRLFSARNSAGSLMDKLSGAMGGKGTFGAQRESELWGALGSTRDATKQVELAGQLTDMVIARQQLEVKNAERMLDFGRSLRGYVDGLKLGSLSPLTNAEKLAEASQQYKEMLGKAQSGDASAQSGLQGIASTYLELARTYFAGNEQFGAIFGSVTSSLDALGVSSMSEAQQQLSLGTQSLGELQRLYSITETAYGSLNAQYETAVSELAAAQDALVLQSDSLEQLKGIAALLSSLPAEISARLPTINTDMPTYSAPLMYGGATASDPALLAELKALREEVAELRAENRQDAQMVAGATVASASASASQIADATAKAAYTTTVKQGAVLV